jgi:hypothetical protein
VALGVFVNAPEQASRHSDVDLLGTPEVLLHRHLNHHPNGSCEIQVGLMLSQGPRGRDLQAFLREQLTVGVDGLPGHLDRLIEGITGRPLHVVCTTGKPLLIVITVYEPKLPKWLTPARRSRDS